MALPALFSTSSSQLAISSTPTPAPDLDDIVLLVRTLPKEADPVIPVTEADITSTTVEGPADMFIPDLEIRPTTSDKIDPDEFSQYADIVLGCLIIVMTVVALSGNYLKAFRNFCNYLRFLSMVDLNCRR